MVEDLPAAQMLASLPRTRGRRRMALVAPLAAAAVAVAAVLTTSPGTSVDRPDRPRALQRRPARRPPSVTGTVPCSARETSTSGIRAASTPRPLNDGSSPTWSPDGSEVAVLAHGGILVTDVLSAATRTVTL